MTSPSSMVSNVVDFNVWKRAKRPDLFAPIHIIYGDVEYAKGERVHYSWSSGRGVRGDPYLSHRTYGTVVAAWYRKKGNRGRVVSVRLNDGGCHLIAPWRRVHHDKRKAQPIVAQWRGDFDGPPDPPKRSA